MSRPSRYAGGRSLTLSGIFSVHPLSSRRRSSAIHARHDGSSERSSDSSGAQTTSTLSKQQAIDNSSSLVEKADEIDLFFHKFLCIFLRHGFEKMEHIQAIEEVADRVK